MPPCAQVPSAVERGGGGSGPTSPTRHLGGRGRGLGRLSLLGGRRGRGRQSRLLMGWGVGGGGHRGVGGGARVQQGRLEAPQVLKVEGRL